MALSKEQQEQLAALEAERDKPEETAYECDVRLGEGPTTTVRGAVAEKWLRQLGLVADPPADKDGADQLGDENDGGDPPDEPPAGLKKFFR